MQDKAFSYDNTDSRYISRGFFKSVRKMLCEERYYVVEQLRRISGDETVEYAVDEVSGGRYAKK